MPDGGISLTVYERGRFRALREILVLRELEELSYRQISESTDLPIGTVMSRLSRARSAFGDAWRRETDDGA